MLDRWVGCQESKLKEKIKPSNILTEALLIFEGQPRGRRAWPGNLEHILQ
jgi:hypothetical protein